MDTELWTSDEARHSDRCAPADIAERIRLCGADALDHLADSPTDARPVRHGLERAMLRARLVSVEVIGRWLLGKPASALELVLPIARQLAAGSWWSRAPDRISRRSAAGWRGALRRYREDVQRRPLMRLQLPIEAVEYADCMAYPDDTPIELPDDRLVISCYTRRVAGGVWMTPYRVEFQVDPADGSVLVHTDEGRDRWPVAASAHPALAELAAAHQADPFAPCSGWVMVFESRVRSTVEEDWHDGYERLTSRADNLLAGCVTAIRRLQPGEKPRQGPSHVSLRRSGPAGQNAKGAASCLDDRGAIEKLLTQLDPEAGTRVL